MVEARRIELRSIHDPCQASPCSVILVYLASGLKMTINHQPAGLVLAALIPTTECRAVSKVASPRGWRPASIWCRSLI